MIANREAYGNTLVKLQSRFKNLVVLDADLAAATYTSVFKKAFPKQFIECGIAEANMMAVAAGLAASGMLPFVSTFAVFASLRAAEQFRNSVCYPHLNVKVVATHAGLECGADGATHQALEDLAVMTAMAGNTVLVPSDPHSTEALVTLAAGFNGPCYIRVGRDKVSDIYKSTEEFHIGGSHKLRNGSDLSILATGDRVGAALAAAKKLEEHGVNAAVYDMYSLKPLDEDAVVEACSCKHIVTVEDHQKYGGLGSAVCQCICNYGLHAQVSVMGVDNSFGRSGPSSELFEFYHIDTNAIVSNSLKNLERQ